MYACLKMNWSPGDFAALPKRQRAAMYAFIDTKVEQEEKQRREMERQRSSSRLGRR